MKNINEFIIESADQQINITRSNKKIKYPKGGSLYSISLPYDKLIEKLGEPEENPADRIKLAWVCQIKKNGRSKTFILYTWEYSGGINEIKGINYISLDVYVPSNSLDEKFELGSDIMKFFGLK